MPYLWEVKIYSCANDYWSTLHTSSCIENMENLVNYSIWTFSHDCFKGFFLNWRVSRYKFIYDIIVQNENIFMCKSLLVYISYFTLYREYGKLGELFNMDPLPWLLQMFFVCFFNWRVSRDNFIYAIIVWNQNIFMWK